VCVANGVMAETNGLIHIYTHKSACDIIVCVCVCVCVCVRERERERVRESERECVCVCMRVCV